jgi:acyl-ACP thioesterase
MFERIFCVPYYGLDMDGRVKTSLLLQLLQESAALHADSVGIGMTDMINRDLTWVLRRYLVRIHNHGGHGDLTVRTWFEPRKNLMSVRAFDILDNAGNRVADAWSGWIVVSLKSGRPVRLDRALPDEYFRFAEPVDENVTDSVETVGGRYDFKGTFRVRRQELDLNGHANHTAYFDWAAESVPDEEVEGRAPMKLEAEYIASIMREDVTVRTKRICDSPLKYAHSLTITERGVEAAKLSTTWTDPRDN